MSSFNPITFRGNGLEVETGKMSFCSTRNQVSRSYSKWLRYFRRSGNHSRHSKDAQTFVRLRGPDLTWDDKSLRKIYTIFTK